MYAGFGSIPWACAGRHHSSLAVAGAPPFGKGGSGRFLGWQAPVGSSWRHYGFIDPREKSNPHRATEFSVGFISNAVASRFLFTASHRWRYADGAINWFGMITFGENNGLSLI